MIVEWEYGMYYSLYGVGTANWAYIRPIVAISKDALAYSNGEYNSKQKFTLIQD